MYGKYDLKEFEKILGYEFNNLDLLYRALTHSSYANEQKEQNIRSNERFEFLGDSVLSIIVSEYIFINYNNLPEGELTRIRAATVCEGSLAEVSKRLNVGDYILLGKGEEVTGGRKRISILSDCFEALLAAIYLDSNLETARLWTLKHLKDTIKKAVDGSIMKDYKTMLQEYYQSISGDTVYYETVKEEGPDHDKKFYVYVFHNKQKIGEGVGRAKKEAEQKAAKQALIKLDVL